MYMYMYMYMVLFISFLKYKGFFMNKIIMLLIVGLFTGVSLPVFGQADVEICNNCSKSQQERVARFSTNYNTEAIIVVDMINERATKFDTYYSEDRFGEPVADVYETSLSSNELHDLALLYEYRKELVRVVTQASEKSMLAQGTNMRKNNHTTMQSSPSSNDNYALGKEIDVKGSPYDFLVYSFVRNDVYDFYFGGKTSGLTRILSQTMRTIKFPNMNKLEVYVRINFYSDDLAQTGNGFISVTLDQTTESFNILGGRDGDNNSIPLNRSQVNGKGFVFSNGGGEQVKFGYYILSFGGGGGGGGGGCRVVKTETKGNRTIYTYQC